MPDNKKGLFIIKFKNTFVRYFMIYLFIIIHASLSFEDHRVVPVYNFSNANAFSYLATFRRVASAREPAGAHSLWGPDANSTCKIYVIKLSG